MAEPLHIRQPPVVSALESSKLAWNVTELRFFQALGQRLALIDRPCDASVPLGGTEPWRATLSHTTMFAMI